MSTHILVEVWENRQRKETSEFDGPVELGRQRDRDEGLFSRKRENSNWRWVIARRDENDRRPQPDPAHAAQRRPRPGHQRQRQAAHPLPRPRRPAARRLLRRRPAAARHPRPDQDRPRPQGRAAGGQMQSLAECHPAAARRAGGRLALPQPGDAAAAQGSAREMIQWLHGVLEVLQAVAESADFLDRAARAVVDAVGLDAARVLLLQDGDWHVQDAADGRAGRFAASCGRPAGRCWSGCAGEADVLGGARPGRAASESLAGLETVIAAPILNKAGEVIGALYGERRRRRGRGPRPSASRRPCWSSCWPAAWRRGWPCRRRSARRCRRGCSSSSSSRRELARQLTLHARHAGGPRRARSRVLFCDIRGFSRISLTLGAATDDRVVPRRAGRAVGVRAARGRRAGRLRRRRADGHVGRAGGPARPRRAAPAGRPWPCSSSCRR